MYRRYRSSYEVVDSSHTTLPSIGVSDDDGPCDGHITARAHGPSLFSNMVFGAEDTGLLAHLSHDNKNPSNIRVQRVLMTTKTRIYAGYLGTTLRQHPCLHALNPPAVGRMLSGV